MKQLDIFGEAHEVAGAANRRRLFEDYDAFIGKFKPKKTTDDCYTPPAVYEAVRGWVVGRCGLQGRRIVRPFYPGGDFEHYPYEEGDVVIDNPPFSILSKIARFYAAEGIAYFLFAPHLTFFNVKPAPTKVVCSADITYENGACVRTSFISNLFPGTAVMTAPGLLLAINEAQKVAAKPLPKYRYPANVLTGTRLDRIIQASIEFELPDGQCRHISRLESQRSSGKGIYGSGFLISDGKAAELKAAELKAAELKAAELKAAELKAAKEAIEWPLLPPEIEIIKSLNP